MSFIYSTSQRQISKKIKKIIQVYKKYRVIDVTICFSKKTGLFVNKIKNYKNLQKNTELQMQQFVSLKKKKL